MCTQYKDVYKSFLYNLSGLLIAYSLPIVQLFPALTPHQNNHCVIPLDQNWNSLEISCRGPPPLHLCLREYCRPVGGRWPLKQRAHPR